MPNINLTTETMAEMAILIAGLHASFSGGNVAAAPAAAPAAPKTRTAPAPTPEPSFVEEVKDDGGAVEKAPDATVAAEPAKRTRSRATPAAEAAPAAEAKADPKSDPKKEPEVSEALLRNLVLKLMGSKGRDAVEGVLKQFGIGRATEIDAARADELVAALEDAARK